VFSHVQSDESGLVSWLDAIGLDGVSAISTSGQNRGGRRVEEEPEVNSVLIDLPTGVAGEGLGAYYWWFYEQLDRSRRGQGWMLDALGLGPVETSFRIAFHAPGLTLRAYNDPDDNTDPVLLIVPAPIKRPYVWDLAPGSSVVRQCLRGGVRVYMIEWAEPRTEEEGFGLVNYGDRLILDCLRTIKREVGESRVFLAAHSLGGTLAAIFATLHPEHARGLVLIAAPLHFGPGVGVFGPLAAAVARVRLTVKIPNRVPGSFLSALSFMASPQSFGEARCVDWIKSLADPQALRTHAQVERWTLDEMPMPRLLFEEVVDLLIRENCLIRGVLRVGRQRAAPQSLRTPLLCVADKRCRIVPPEAVVPFLQAARSSTKRMLWYRGDTGVSLQHVGPLVGRTAHEHLWPEILRWIHAHSGRT